MLVKKWVIGIVVLVLCSSVYANEVKTASGIVLDTKWKTSIYEYAKKNFIHTAWGVGHSERNYNLAIKLAEMDNLAIDKDALFAASFLHDVGSFNRVKGEDHAVTSAKMMDKLLKDFDFPMQKLTLVKNAILGHMYKAKVVDEPTAYVLHDADTLDFMGNIGIARVISLTTRVPSWVPTLDKSFGTLGRINAKFGTMLKAKAAKKIAIKRSKEAQVFLKTVDEETYGKTSI